MTDAAPDDEYIVTYRHLGKRLNVLHWQSKEDGGNRRSALKHAAAAAVSMDVQDLQIARRPKGKWEPLDWRQEVASSGPSSYDERKDPSEIEA